MNYCYNSLTKSNDKLALGSGKKIIYSTHLANLSPNDFSKASQTTPHYKFCHPNSHKIINTTITPTVSG